MVVGFSDASIVVLGALMVGAVLVGLYMTRLAWRAYRITQSLAHRWMTIGMGLITLGAVAEGFAFHVVGLSLGWSQTWAAGALLLGLSCFVRSLHLKEVRKWPPANGPRAPPLR